MLRSERLAAVGTLAAGPGPRGAQPAQLGVAAARRCSSGASTAATSRPRCCRSPTSSRARSIASIAWCASSWRSRSRARSNPRPVDVGELFSAVAALIAPEAESVHVSIAVDVAAGTPAVLGEAERLRQVLLNLTRNAVEAMSDERRPAPPGRAARGRGRRDRRRGRRPRLRRGPAGLRRLLHHQVARHRPRPRDRPPHRRRSRRHDPRRVAPGPDLLHAGAAGRALSRSASARRPSTAVNTPTTSSPLTTIADPTSSRAISAATVSSWASSTIV